ncbi:MAG: hypothetical protein ABIU10_09715 [Sphingomicrobium sp.]
MHFARPIFFLVLALAGCGPYPRDMDGTLEHIRTQRVIRVGLTNSLDDKRQRALISDYLQRVGQATGATSRITVGPAEPLLVQLDDQRLDLVISEVATNSPWMTEVAMIEPLAEHKSGGRTIGLSPIARNGENQWIALLETQSRGMKDAR